MMQTAPRNNKKKVEPPPSSTEDKNNSERNLLSLPASLKKAQGLEQIH